MVKKVPEEQNLTWIELRSVKTSWKRWRESFEEEKRRERIRLSNEFEDEMARLAIRAMREGMTKAAIGRALMNTSPNYLEALLGRDVVVEEAETVANTDTHDAPYKIEKGYEHPQEWYLHYSALRGSDFIGGVLVRVQDGEIEIHPSTLTDESTRVVEGSKNAILRMIAEEEAKLAPEPVTEWGEDDPFAEE